VPTPDDEREEIWGLSSSSRFWDSDTTRLVDRYGGYVAFGTLDSVIYGGCQNGLIPTNSSISVNIPETASRESVLRFEVSQYNSQAIVRIQNISIDVFVDFADYTAYIEEPVSSPGGFLVPELGGLAGGPRGPIALTPDGSGVITTLRDRTVGKIIIA
jgi:hypothetical protein